MISRYRSANIGTTLRQQNLVLGPPVQQHERLAGTRLSDVNTKPADIHPPMRHATNIRHRERLGSGHTVVVPTPRGPKPAADLLVAQRRQLSPDLLT